MRRLLFNLKKGLFIAFLLFSTQLALAQVPYLVKNSSTEVVQNPSNLVNVNGTLYYTVENSGESSLWKASSSSSPQLVKQLGSGSSRLLTAVNGTLFFVNNYNLWKSDGTSAGTIEVMNASGKTFSNLSGFKVIGNSLYFRAYSELNGNNYYFVFWKIEATTTGTRLEVDTQGYYIRNTFDYVGTDIYYFNDEFSDEGVAPVRLRKTNGTTVTTITSYPSTETIGEAVSSNSLSFLQKLMLPMVKNYGKVMAHLLVHQL
ncbi:hypothetical protein [Emticicia sp. C21]|uniref:hypothetical protein n=1 Tax=Emticicia sp. C21 TaxID=2302915 RepID=UPI000E3451E0|nr:hypothetical protein [Emticicia sp. C21]RFS17743.1 hypothetical protein D0T08_00375 [Emticicia sp. C21]